MSRYSDDLRKQVIEKQDLSDEAAKFALDYFSHFFHNPAFGPLTEENIPEYVRKFQVAIGVTPDGELDSQVVKAMQTIPRCGCRDYSLIAPEAFGSSPKWGLSEVSYYVDKYITGLSTGDQDDLMQMAFNAWSAVADIRFKRVSNQSGANIIISNGKGAPDNFDGPSGTLAWAYLPPQANFKGQLLMRFDLDETWIKNSSDRGILYLNVATHEFGHLCGLEHSQISSALMAPYYNINITKPQKNDDVSRIQTLYGVPTLPVPPTPVPPPPVPPTGKIKVEVMVNSLSDIKINGKSVVETDVNFDLI